MTGRSADLDKTFSVASPSAASSLAPAGANVASTSDPRVVETRATRKVFEDEGLREFRTKATTGVEIAIHMLQTIHKKIYKTSQKI